MDQPLPGRLSGAQGIADAPTAPPATLVIFGGGGDLTKRLLMPSIYNLRLAGCWTTGSRSSASTTTTAATTRCGTC